MHHALPDPHEGESGREGVPEWLRYKDGGKASIMSGAIGKRNGSTDGIPQR